MIAFPLQSIAIHRVSVFMEDMATIFFLQLSSQCREFDIGAVRSIPKLGDNPMTFISEDSQAMYTMYTMPKCFFEIQMYVRTLRVKLHGCGWEV